MKHLCTVIRGNVRKNKGAYFGIMILMFIVSLSFVSIYNVATNTKQRHKQAMEEISFGDYWAYFKSDLQLSVECITAEEIIEKIEQCDSVEKVKSADAYNTNIKIDEDTRSYVILIDYDNEMAHYVQYNEDNSIRSDNYLGAYEMSVPVTYRNMYGLHVGDKLYINCGEDEEIEFTIASFFEDPIMGSSVMGIKTILIGEESHAALDGIIQASIDRGDGVYYVVKNKAISIYKTDSSIKDADFERELNNATGFAGYTEFGLSVNQSEEYTLMMPNLFAGVAAIFIIVLLIAAFVVMGHSINSSIEQDFTNMGIYKAMGMTGSGIRISFVISYSVASVIGLLLGIPVAIPIISAMDGLMRESTGLYPKADISFNMGIIMVVVTVAAIAFFVMLKSRRITKITPVAALSDGAVLQGGHKKIKTRINPKCLNLSLAMRQITSGINRYVSVIIVTILLTIFMVIMNNVYVWASDDDLMEEFMLVDFDAVISYDDENADKVDEIISGYSDYEEISLYNSYILLDDVQVNCEMISNPEKIRSISEGKPCVNDNEIMITSYIKDAFDLEVGDTVNVSIMGVTKELYVSGVSNISYDLGKCIIMGMDTRATFKVGEYADNYDDVMGKEENRSYWYYLALSDPSKLDDIKAALYDEFAENGSLDDSPVFFQTKDEAMSGADALGDIGVGIKTLTLFVYVLGAVFVCITISLVASKTMHSEKKDYGIYKSIGIPSGKLRRQMSTKFVIVALFGTVIGDILGAIILKPVLKVIFSQFGMVDFVAKINLSDILIPILFMTAVAYICAFVSSGKIKRVEPRILIIE